jgi:flagellar biogenesis protein FliO
MEWVLLKTLVSLAAVLGLMGLVVAFMKRFVYGRRRRGNAPVEVEILGSRVLQPKRSVFVLRVLDAVIVVGSSEEGLQTLARVGDRRSRELLEQLAPAPAAADPVPEPARPSLQAFSGVLRQALASAWRNGAPTGGKA